MPTFGIKQYLYAIGVVLLLALFGWYTYHERQAGKQSLQASNDALALSRLEASGLSLELHTRNLTKIGDTYARTIATPPVGSPSVLCRRPPVRELVPETAANPGVDHAEPVVPAEDPVDIGAPLDTVGRDADAQVIALQATVRDLEAAMLKASK